MSGYRTDCVDCGKTVIADTGDVENYLVHDSVWAEAGMGYDDGFLCLDCLGKRLGRDVTAADLRTDVPLNYPGVQRDTPRLRAMKSEVMRAAPFPGLVKAASTWALGKLVDHVGKAIPAASVHSTTNRETTSE